MIKEFKEFALKGNMLDLAIGIIIGAAFSAIVTSIVKDLIMPLLSIFTSNIDFANMFVSLDGKTYSTLEEAVKEGAATINYGNFITQFINFLVIAIVIFIFVKQINKMRKPVIVVAKEPTKACPYCFTDINKKATRCPSCTAELILEAEALK